MSRYLNGLICSRVLNPVILFLIKSDYEIKLKQQEIVQKVGNANMLTKALIDRLINKVYVFPGDRIEIEYATQDFLETKESEKEV